MHDLPLIDTIAGAFTVALVLGVVTQRLRLSPIVGYLLAGVIIGPYTPGLMGDVQLAGQLAEIGVILLMFGVGLHFRLGDLLSVRTIAIPGAIGQSAIATVLGLAMAAWFGWPAKTGLAIGMAMAVASTVVLVRVLQENQKMDSAAGRAAIGWLIVEDLLTAMLLVLIPVLGGAPGDADAALSGGGAWAAMGMALLKLTALLGVVLMAGAKVIPWVMVQVTRLRSRELFTLTVLVMAIAVAAGSFHLFGSSMALGAFLAGMLVGQSPVSQQAGADILPMRDAFAVLFFTSVGMLFDPAFLVHEPLLVLAGLAIVLIGKPLAALAIVAILGHPSRTGLTVALGLAQIGEFSFILSQVGRQQGLLDDKAHNLLVACALISITLNPLLCRQIDRLEVVLLRHPRLWRLLNRNEASLAARVAVPAPAPIPAEHPLAVVVGYGPVGQAIDTLLRKEQVETTVVDLNLDVVQALRRQGRRAIYGDAANIEVLRQVLPGAAYLLITLPHSENRSPMIAAAKRIHPSIRIFVRARYIGEQEELLQAGADGVCFEETESAVALTRLVLQDRGAGAEAIDAETAQIRRRFQAFSCLSS